MTRIEFKTDAGMATVLPDMETVQTEVQVLKSRGLAAQVIRDLSLDKMPVFIRELTGQAHESPVAWVEHLTRSAYEKLRDRVMSAKAEQPHETPAEWASSAIDLFLSKLTVTSTPNSRIISVKFNSRDPKLAAAAANSLIAQYIADQVQIRSSAAREATTWLQDQVKQLREKADESDRAVQEFTTKARLFDGLAPLSRQLAETETELSAAQIARKDLEVRVAHMGSLLKATDGIYGENDVLNSVAMVNLREKMAELRRTLARLSEVYGGDYPKIRSIKAEIADAEQAERAEAVRIASALEAELRVDRTKEDLLQRRLATLKSEMSASGSAEVKLKALQQTANKDRTVLEAFVGRLREATQLAERGVQRANAEIVSRADVPRSPSKPRVGMLLAISALVSAGAGIGAALVRDRADPTFLTGDQVELEVGPATVALVPRVGSAPGVGVSGSEPSVFHEAIKGLYMTLTTRRNLKLLVVTSAHPAEGKTTLAINLARIAALGRRRILLIDADLCKRGASCALDLSAREGLAEVISGTKEFADVVATERESDLDFLPAGTLANANTARSALESIGPLLRRLSAEYDLIIVDSPPLLALSDAMALSALADGTLFAVRWGTTRRDAAKLAMKRIVSSGGYIAGIALTMVNPRAHSGYRYADSAFYAKSVRSYLAG